SAVQINNRRSLFDDLVEICLHGRQRLISEKSLLRIAQDRDFQPCQLTDFSEDKQAVLSLTQRTGRHRPVCVNLVAVHDPDKIPKHTAKLLLHLGADLPVGVSVLSQLDPMTDLVNAPYPLFSGNLKNLQKNIISANVYGRKRCHLHIFSSFMFRDYPVTIPLAERSG